jgi:hypothetical protein
MSEGQNLILTNELVGIETLDALELAERRKPHVMPERVGGFHHGSAFVAWTDDVELDFVGPKNTGAEGLDCRNRRTQTDGTFLGGAHGIPSRALRLLAPRSTPPWEVFSSNR